MTDARDWMPRLCDPAWSNEACKAPFSIELDGISWDAVLNPHFLVMAHGRSFDQPSAATEKTLRWALDTHGLEGSGSTVTLDALRSWIANADPERGACETCKGGEIKRFKCSKCAGSGNDACYHCGSSVDCEECEGDGYIEECPDCDDGLAPEVPVFGRIGHLTVNLHLVRRSTGALTAESVRVHTGDGELGPLWFVADNWRVLLMPARSADGPQLLETTE